MPVSKTAMRAARVAKLHDHYYLTYANGMGRKDGIVPGEGDPLSRVVIIGEAPGEEEERLGKPFIGPSGNLLMKMLRRSAGLTREDVFITNLVKHRPPGNADPTPQEAMAARVCMNWELNILKPGIVVTLGRFATEVFYPNPSMRSLSGTSRVKQLEPYGPSFVVIPIYHPSAALRSSVVRSVSYDHFKVLKDTLATLNENPLT